MSPSPPPSYSTTAARHPQRFIALRPKGEAVLITFPEDAAAQVDSRRKQHAISQKNQRDRLKAALEQMARVLHAGGFSAGSGPRGPAGTKVELIESAVEYIQSHEKEVNMLRSSVTEVQLPRPDGGESTRTSARNATEESVVRLNED